MKRVVAVTLIVALCALAGCETAKGIGKDMQRAGKSIEKAAKQ